MGRVPVRVTAVTWPTTMPTAVDPGAVVDHVTGRAMCSGPIPARGGVWPRAVRAGGGTA